MRKTLGLLVIIALLVGAWGYHRGWFTVARGGSDDTPNVTFGLDKDKLKHDTDTTTLSYEHSLSSHKGKLGKLEELGKSAAAEQKSAIEKQVKDFSERHDALSKKLSELKAASGAKYDQLKTEMKSEIDGLGSELDQALADVGKK